MMIRSAPTELAQCRPHNKPLYSATLLVLVGDVPSHIPPYRTGVMDSDDVARNNAYPHPAARLDVPSLELLFFAPPSNHSRYCPVSIVISGGRSGIGTESKLGDRVVARAGPRRD